MLPVRVFFEKKDMARYISHLDLQRAVRRAVERSGLTVRQTEGFNPHPKMVFSMPLSMYQESLCEFVDMEMDGAGYDEIAARLAAAFPPGLRVTAAAASGSVPKLIPPPWTFGQLMLISSSPIASQASNFSAHSTYSSIEKPEILAIAFL